MKLEKYLNDGIKAIRIFATARGNEYNFKNDVLNHANYVKECCKYDNLKTRVTFDVHYALKRNSVEYSALITRIYEEVEDVNDKHFETFVNTLLKHYGINLSLV